jgi:hypothetical protein
MTYPNADTLAAKAGAVSRESLLGPFERPLGSGEGGNLGRLLELTDDDRPYCPGEPMPHRLVRPAARRSRRHDY